MGVDFVLRSEEDAADGEGEEDRAPEEKFTNHLTSRHYNN